MVITENSKQTQEQQVIAHLKEKGAITPLDALRHIGCFRLAAIIHRLRAKGYKITTSRITKRGRFGQVNFAQYKLEK